MSLAQLMRPAAHSAAVRPHSASLPAPRPASAASSCFASIFFRPCTPAHWQAIMLVSRRLFPLSWEQIAPWEHSWEQKKGGITASYAIVPSVPTFPHARVIHMRAHTHGLTPLFLGTWEQCSIVFANQRLAVFPSLFPSLSSVGTWEHSEGVGSSSDRLRAGANKVGPGYRDQQRPAGRARRKFRGSIAAVQAAGELEQQRIRQLPTRHHGNGGNRPLSERLAGHVGRAMLEGSAQGPENAAQSAARPAGRARRKFRGSIAAVQAAGELEQQRIRQLPTRHHGNGGNRPLSERLAGHVGRAMLEGSAQGPENAAQSAARRKLGRLSAVALGELAGAALDQPSEADGRRDRPGEAPGAPNRAPSSAAVLPLHGDGIWIEDRAAAAILRGQYSDRTSGSRKVAQTSTRRRGPGGFCLSKAAEKAERARNREAGGRAGVNPPAVVARSHETGEKSKLRRVSAAVNGGF